MRRIAVAHVLPGDHLPKQHPFGAAHVVYEVHDLPDGGRRIVTSHGEWTYYDSTTLLDFPRRSEGVIDWTKSVHPPEARDLCIGDIVSPVQPSPLFPNPRHIDDDVWTQMPPAKQDQIQRMFRASCQTVCTITAHTGSEELLDITMSSAQRGGTRRSTWHLREPIIFPRQDSTLRARAKGRGRISRIVKNGPYTSHAGELVWVAQHPYGRGRWPVELTNGLLKDADTGIRIVRPPTTPLQWNEFIFHGEDPYDRHPRDPLYGQERGEPLPE